MPRSFALLTYALPIVHWPRFVRGGKPGHWRAGGGGIEGAGGAAQEKGEHPSPWLWQGGPWGAAAAEGSRRVDRLEITLSALSISLIVISMKFCVGEIWGDIGEMWGDLGEGGCMGDTGEIQGSCRGGGP